MASPKYPLKPLLDHRERQVDDATAELGDAVRAREAAEQARLSAERVRQEAEAAAAKVKAAEQEKLAAGELSVADLARAEAWHHGAQSQLQSLTQAVDVARSKEHAAENTEQEARGTLAHTMSNRDVVAKDEQRFVARQKKKSESAEEEAAEEAWRPQAENGRSSSK